MLRSVTAPLLVVLALLTFAPPSDASGPEAPDLQTLLAGLPEAAAAAIGERIRWNETGGRDEWLVHWAPGEAHASLGIGHFIWYPAGARGPYRESFPEALRFMGARGVRLPDWLQPSSPCPWPDRAAFLEAQSGRRTAELRRFLAETVGDQLAFMASRLADALPALLQAAGPGRRTIIQSQLARVLLDAEGRLRAGGAYALIDYVNFKGEGLDPGERHAGEGWGLLQVLEVMAGEQGDGGAAFAAAAARVLERRVGLAPERRNERRWLPGWLKRVRTYATFAPERDGPAGQAALGN
jgi:hypothetical protein